MQKELRQIYNTFADFLKIAKSFIPTKAFLQKNKQIKKYLFRHENTLQMSLHLHGQ